MKIYGLTVKIASSKRIILNLTLATFFLDRYGPERDQPPLLLDDAMDSAGDLEQALRVQPIFGKVNKLL